MRSTSSFSCSIVMASALTARSPAKRSGAAGADCSSLRSPNQAANARGSLASSLADPANCTPLPAAPRWPLSRSWLMPGARNSSPLISTPWASALTSAARRTSVAPPSVTLSALRFNAAGMGNREAASRDSASALTASSGRRVSGSARTRSRSICGDDSVPLNSGCRPRRRSAPPLSLIARSSGPYWNSICSKTAAALSPLTRLVTRHGSRMSEPAPAGARPTARTN